ncbi:hypothetical protein B0H65DRAFT_213576 [Neurospora tetraspora]|uniref:Aminoglycoside phosphotransferase domain-containing protein n=1 Tax=Neurospora tetraspora TaxID=94610 RepID=A0AAE0MTM9_9PEZI|nr:hypothetical protein B0H65DRAFT_213576 [Neurospora tetraspora]
MSQWTMAQAELASFTFPTIGSISEYSTEKGPTIGPIATPSINGFADRGPLSSSWEYFRNIADARFKATLQRSSSPSPSHSTNPDPESPSELDKLGHFIFRDLVYNSPLFRSPPSAPAVNGPFPFNHMDLGIQNILVSTSPDSSSGSTYDFLAVIDWEMAQSAPWEVFYYPVPFPLLSSQQESLILRDEKHPEYDKTVKKQKARDLYRQKFREAEEKLEAEGRPLPASIAGVLEGSKASRCFGVVEKLGVFKGVESELVRELVRLGYGEEGKEMRKGEVEGWLKVKRREMEAFLKKGGMVKG